MTPLGLASERLRARHLVVAGGARAPARPHALVIRFLYLPSRPVGLNCRRRTSGVWRRRRIAVMTFNRQGGGVELKERLR